MQIPDVVPPDDSGRDAFSRFRYQAHAIFPACLGCATGDGPAAVICEHIEDVCIDGDERVILRQIKTRNLDYGGWRIKDLCGLSGALRSILRAHRAIDGVDDDREIIYEIQLEGFLARNDMIRRLARRETCADDEAARAIVKAFRQAGMRVSLKESREIVSRLVVFVAPQREVIVSTNLRLLAALAGHLPAKRLSEMYEGVIELIAKAMEGSLVGDIWPAALFAVAHGRADGVDLADKRLDPEILSGPLKSAVSGEPPVLSGITEAELAGATDLVRKLRLAGASDELIDRAKSLRAYASRREFELRARDMAGAVEAELEDVDNRLLTTGAVSLGLHGSGAHPAPAVFADLMARLAAQSDTHDPRSLFHRDPMLLLGGLCQLSDECRYSWRSDA